MWARIENDLVQEIIDFDPEGRFHESLVWTPCSDDVEAGWGYDELSNRFFNLNDDKTSTAENNFVERIKVKLGMEN